MPLLRWSHALLAVLVLAGCKKDEPAAPTSPPAAPPAAKAPAAAPAPAPASGPVLSYLRSVDPERCDWVRQPLPSGEPTTVFTFDAACDRSMVSWSPDAKEGLVFTWPSGEGEVPQAWRVDVGARAGKPLDLKALPGGTEAGAPDKPFIEQISFDRQGRPVALVADIYNARKTRKGADGQEVIASAGAVHPLPEVDGSPGLAMAWRLEGGTWKRVETKGSRYESDIAPGTQVLETVKTLLPTTKASLSERMPGQEAPESAVKLLDAAFPGQDESGQWMALSTPGGRLYYRGTLGGEFLYPSPPVRWEKDGKLVELDGLLAKEGDFLEPRLQGGLLLISVQGETRVAQVWDTRTQQHVLTVEDAVAPAFWPEPAKP